MLRLPVVTKGITLQEVPGEVAVFFELGNCTLECPGCHSEHLWASKNPIPKAKQMWMEELVVYAKQQKDLGATAILINGGTTNHVPLEDLWAAIHDLSKVLPVCVYSGEDENAHSTKVLMSHPWLKWLKTGPWREELGGLWSPATNQRFWEWNGDEWVDKTYLFQK